MGYDEGRATPDVVIQQVNAIFDTLQFVYHMHYAEDNVPFDRDAEQVIQLPRDVLPANPLLGPDPAAMCLETTAIIASAVERLGMRPYFVIVPGHAFLAVALGPSPSAPKAYWETSFLGDDVYGSQAALYANQTEYPMYQSQGKVLAVIDIAAERLAGIEPIE